MCGIVGYVGKNEALPVLLDGLKRLEYRGYDSAGLACLYGGEVFSVKAVGKIAELEKKLVDSATVHKPDKLNIGIAHTRWATHGAPTEANAHPHTDCRKNIWLVHNGIIENHSELRKHLEAKGHKFSSETDTEVLSHLIEDLYQGSLSDAVKQALKIIKGTYGIAVFHKNEPGKIIAAKNGSPLVIGVSDNETIIASDVSAILRYTKQVFYLDDGEIAEIGAELKIFDAGDLQIKKEATEIEWDFSQAERGGWDHFMIKEINEQPEAVMNSIRGRYLIEDGKARFGGLDILEEKIRAIKRIVIIACGTARHAGLVGEYMLEEYAGIPVEVDYASEFRYRQSVFDQETAVLVISQSGETADTLAALKEAKGKGMTTLGIVNVVGSSIARETDAGIYNHIGPEIAVASTKAFTSQLAILSLLTVYLGRQRNMSLVIGKRITEELNTIPEKIRTILAASDEIKKIAKKYSAAENFAFLGRKYNSAAALEGALKLKEVSYIHAEGFVSGEMKHGSIALITDKFPSLFICPQDSVYEKNISNLTEIKSRGGKVIAIATTGDDRLETLADDVIYIPKTLEMLTPILAAIPLQLFAYHMAAIRGLDVDKPRNLAKSVTVE
jgi:glucosamine--fructose-6-phosphate aminotransferase (isomerizing)